MNTEFGSFVRNGVRFNCMFDRTTKNRKGILVRYWKSKPMADGFYHSPDSCRVKIGQILPFQKVRYHDS